MPFRQSSIDELCEQTGLRQYQVAAFIEVPHSTVYRWNSGKSRPNIANLDKLYELASEFEANVIFYEPPKRVKSS